MDNLFWLLNGCIRTLLSGIVTGSGGQNLGVTRMVMTKFGLEGKLHEENRLIQDGVLRDDNPLDQSHEFNDFLIACRHGDLRKCQELINQGVNINGKDKFDYTPLIIVSFIRYVYFS